MEQSNKFSNGILFANNREFKVAIKEEQELIVACKVLTQNAIVLWNYLYLSQILVNNKNLHERKEIIKMISIGSVITWYHVNLHGKYDFSKRAFNDNKFEINQILSLKVV